MKAGTFSVVPICAVRAQLSAADWRVLLAICMHADKHECACISMARIAALAGMKRNHIPRSIAHLEERGLFRCIRSGPAGGWQVSHYEVVFDALEGRPL